MTACHPTGIHPHRHSFVVIPARIQKELAKILDTDGDTNWEKLAEAVGCPARDANWIKYLARNATPPSPTLTFFKYFLVSKDVSVRSVIEALIDIGNIDCTRILEQFINNRPIHVFVTYTEDSKRHVQNVVNLCEFLCSRQLVVGLDKAGYSADDTMARYARADCVLIVISPLYLQVIKDDDKTHPAGLNAHHIYQHLNTQHSSSSGRCPHFVPVVMSDTLCTSIPQWLQHNSPPFVYPGDGNKLLGYLSNKS